MSNEQIILEKITRIEEFMHSIFFDKKITKSYQDKKKFQLKKQIKHGRKRTK